MDGKEGGHFNLTQVPFDVEIDENGFAFDYQVAITFELCERTLLRDEIYAKTEERLKAMKIDLGEILGEPIAILCFHGSKRWSETIKLHLKNPQKDANDLLYGKRSFIFKLDNITYCRGKVFKSFDSIAIASILSVKITSPTLKDKKWFFVHEEIVKYSFKRGYEFEITSVQKNDEAEFAWIKTPSPEQAKKVKTTTQTKTKTKTSTPNIHIQNKKTYATNTQPTPLTRITPNHIQRPILIQNT